MADHPFDTAAETVDANVTPGGVTETLLDAMKLRTALALGATETLGNFDFSSGSPPNAVVYGATGYVYFYNADDTTSPDDGSTCLVSADGRRYILADMSAMAISAVLAIDDDPPVTPVDGDAYVIGTSPTSSWVGHAKDIALYTPRGWVFAQPKVGTALLNIETEENIQYSAAGVWGVMPTSLEVDAVAPEQIQFWGGLSIEAQQNDPPGSPAEGEYYLVGLIPTGDWAGHENDVAYYTSTSVWAFLAAYDGAKVYNKSSGADLAWVDAAGVWRSASPTAWMVQGRLTLESGVAISTTDQTAKATLYFTPFRGNFISLYSNGGWATIDFEEKSISLAGWTTGKPNDIFGYLDGGDLALERVEWTNDTTRATALALQDGFWVKSGDASRRYLGTIYTSASGQCEDSLAKRYVFNAYNAVPRPMRCPTETTDSWAYGGGLRQARASSSNQIDFVVGLNEREVRAQVSVTANSQFNAGAFVAIGLDSTSAIAAGSLSSGLYANLAGHMSASYCDVPGIGKHRLTWLESTGGSNANFYGDNGGIFQSGISGTVWC